jgi:hypothetical protein
MRVGRHGDRRAPRHLNRHFVVEVEGHVQDDLVARLGDSEHGVHERHVGAGGHHHAAALGNVNAVFGAQLDREPLQQRWQTRTVLIRVRRRARERRLHRAHAASQLQRL